MTKKSLFTLALVLVLAAGAAVLWAANRPKGEWTTESEAALAAVRAGRQAELQLYREEALEHYERALALDPGFTFAKLKVATLTPPVEGRRERIAELVEELKAADLEPLTPRERLLVEDFRARLDHDPQRAAALLEAHLREHPDDPYAVEMRCHQLWARSDFAPAEACYRRLIEIDPNWVEAQNRIGYLAMERGDFADAEEQFEIYRYLAPDQANPHDSLGELMLLLGRYDEAEREFRQALELRGTFCPSWQNLVTLDLLRGDFTSAEQSVAAARRVNGCPERALDVQACRVAAWRAGADGRWAEMEQVANDCMQRSGTFDLVVLALAAGLRTGGSAVTDEAVESMRESLDTGGRSMESGVLHMVLGMHRLQEGDPAAAVDHLRRADERLPFGQGLGVDKLFDRMLLAHALQATGRGDEAAEVVQSVRRIHPSFAPPLVPRMPLLPRADDSPAPPQPTPPQTAPPQTARPSTGRRG